MSRNRRFGRFSTMTNIYLHKPNVDAIEAFAADPAWRDNRFWMLNTFRFHPGSAAANQEYGHAMRDVLARVGAKPLFGTGVARTLIGARPWEGIAIVEYPGSAAFYEMATSDALRSVSHLREKAFADQTLIPMSPDFLPAYDASAKPTGNASVGSWDLARAEKVTSAFVGGHHTQTSHERIAELVDDEAFDHAQTVYMLNLHQYDGDEGKRRHNRYVAGFTDGAMTTRYGVRVAYSSRAVGPVLIGDVRWDNVAMVVYPSVHHFLAMGADPDYRKLHIDRKDGLSGAYIIALQTRKPLGS